MSIGREIILAMGASVVLAAGLWAQIRLAEKRERGGRRRKQLSRYHASSAAVDGRVRG